MINEPWSTPGSISGGVTASDEAAGSEADGWAPGQGGEEWVRTGEEEGTARAECQWPLIGP